MNTTRLLVAASVAMGTPLAAQQAAAPSPPAAAPEKVVEGNTPGRVAQIANCQGRKFESTIEIDPVKKRSTTVKLCANPGSSDADWVKTLRAALVQIEQRNMPPVARDKLIGALRAEIERFAPAPKAATDDRGGPLTIGTESGARSVLIAPTERFETSVLPPLTRPKAAVTGSASSASPPQPPMRIAVKCLEQRESGPGATCDFFNKGTTLVVSAVEGLEQGGLLRFNRRGEARGEVRLAAMQKGRSVRVKLPAELCRGVAATKVELELLGPKSGATVAARLGPFEVRC